MRRPYITPAEIIMTIAVSENFGRAKITRYTIQTEGARSSANKHTPSPHQHKHLKRGISPPLPLKRNNHLMRQFSPPPDHGNSSGHSGQLLCAAPLHLVQSLRHTRMGLQQCCQLEAFILETT